jgi:CubicO group peptidase (beta-lactamase class C family)
MRTNDDTNRRWLGRAAAALSLSLLLVGGAAAQAPPDPVEPSPALTDAELAERIAAYVRPLAESGELSGTLLVDRGGRVIYEESFGLASYELGVPNRPETRFNVASLTKPVTQIVTLKLVESGKLGISDPLSKWIPDFPRGDEITVETLARHRSGLPHRVTTAMEETVWRSAADMVELAKGAELAFEPGSQQLYSSTGYAVLARVLELAGGAPWPDLVEELVLAPAGARHTLHPPRFEPMPDRASSYFRGPHGPIPGALKDLSFLVGAGSLYSTPRDLLAIQRRVLEGGYGELVRSQLVRDGGLSWNGLTNGVRAFAEHHPESGLTVILTANLFTGAGDLLRRDLPKIAAGEEVAPPEVPRYDDLGVVALTEATAARYEGMYQLTPGVEASAQPLTVDGEHVRLGDWVLIPTSETTFLSPQDYGRMTVVKGEDGTVTALQWGEQESGGPRFPRGAESPRTE